MFWQAVFPACSYAEVQKEGTAGHDLGSGSREERPPGVFSLLLLRGGVGLRKAVFVLRFPGVMGAGEGCREMVFLEARPECRRVMGKLGSR